MSRTLRCLFVLFLLLCGAVPHAPPRTARLSAASRSSIRDPARARSRPLRLGRMLAPERSADTPLSNRDLFRLPSMVPVREALDREFDRYVARHKANLPNESIGVGDGLAFQLFDRGLFDTPKSVSCWPASSTAWIVPMWRRRAAARSG